MQHLRRAARPNDFYQKKGRFNYNSTNELCLHITHGNSQKKTEKTGEEEP